MNSRYSETTGLLNQTDLSGQFEVGGIKNSFALSAEFSEEKAKNGSYVSNAATGAAIATGTTATGGRCGTDSTNRYNCTSLTDPNPSDPWVSYVSDASNVVAGIERSLPKTWTLSKTTTKAVSLFDTITITDSLLINLGGRFDRYETRVSPGLAVNATTDRSWYERNDNLWTYQAGLIFKPASNGSIYISTSSAATPPGSYLANGSEGNALNTSGSTTQTPQELTDALKIEKTKSYEVGTKWNLFSDSLALTLAAFQTETKNARATDANGFVSFIGERRIKGIELSFNGNITPEWNVFGGYTYMDSKIVDGGFTATSGVYAPSVNTGKRFPNTPEHSFTAFTNYKVTSAFTVGGGAIYMGKVYGGYSDSRSVQNGVVVISKELARYAPSYWRFDGNASYSFNENFQLQVNVQNMFNKRYFDKAYASHYVSQAAGRTAIATLNVKF
ncbi:TonB-dependent receptor [Novosphingobium sp. ST904]|uniref:TonB-dependent receptor n=1 Tax=Novosphingobium sp. ST904 TaxID=1684385 RepID=UPI000AA85B22